MTPQKKQNIEEKETVRSSNNKKLLKPAAIILLIIAVLVTGACVLTETGLAARFISQSTGTDSANVAKFDVRETGELISQEIAASLVPGTPSENPLEITNNSEVAVKYVITIENETGNIEPMKMSLWEKTVPEKEITPVEGSTDLYKQFIIEDVPNGAARTFNMKFSIAESEESEDPDPNLTYMGQVDRITISVIAEQID